MEEAWSHALRDFRPQPFRLQPKEEMKVKRADKCSRDRQSDDNWGRSVLDGWKLALIQGNPHLPISYTPNYCPCTLKAGRAYSCKSLGLLDVLVARVLGSALMFGSSTNVFLRVPESLQLQGYLLLFMGHFWKIQGPSLSCCQNYGILSILTLHSLEQWFFFPQTFLYNRYVYKVKLLGSKPATSSAWPLP